MAAAPFRERALELQAAAAALRGALEAKAPFALGVAAGGLGDGGGGDGGGGGARVALLFAKGASREAAETVAQAARELMRFRLAAHVVVLQPGGEPDDAGAVDEVALALAEEAVSGAEFPPPASVDRHRIDVAAEPEALRDVLLDCDVVLTAHDADDEAELVRPGGDIAVAADVCAPLDLPLLTTRSRLGSGPRRVMALERGGAVSSYMEPATLAFAASRVLATEASDANLDAGEGGARAPLEEDELRPSHRDKDRL